MTASEGQAYLARLSETYAEGHLPASDRGYSALVYLVLCWLSLPWKVELINELQEAECMDKFEQRLEQAARAAWLSYVGGRTQDEIATQLGVSRPGVQRLLALARQEKLVKTRIDHPVAGSMMLADILVERFGLSFCDVVPSDTQSNDNIAEFLAVAGAERLAFYLNRHEPQTISLSTGRTVRAAVEALSRTERPQHRVVSLVGSVALDGSSNRYDGVMLLADKLGADRYLLPAPVVAASLADKQSLLEQNLVQAVFKVASEANVGVIGIGRLDAKATLFQDQFISARERDELMAIGAVGELMGWPLDVNGKLIDCPLTQRITSLPLTSLNTLPLIGMAGGRDKAPAILSALRGGWLEGLIIDESAAEHVCAAL